jgi:hypothetical protein
MADIALTAARVSPVNEFEYEAWTLLAGATITRGQAVAIDATTGKAAVADGSTGAANNVRGIALNGAAAGEAVTIMVHGSLYGFTLAGNYDSAVYLSNTAGALADAAGDVSVVVGRVRPMHDGATPTKVLYVNIPAVM